jgi:hypothetical protein
MQASRFASCRVRLKRMNKRERQKLCRADSAGVSRDESSFEYHGCSSSIRTRARAWSFQETPGRNPMVRRYWFQNAKRATTEDKRGDSRMAGYTKRENIIETFLSVGRKGSRYPTGKCLPECMLRVGDRRSLLKDGEEHPGPCMIVA